MHENVITVEGGQPLRGLVANAGSKNAALPILAASMLADGPVVLENVPDLGDVATLSLLLGHLGVEVKRRADHRIYINTVDPSPTRADGKLVSRMRASFCVLGPLMARRRTGIVALPGGCRLGPRPVDLHLKGFVALGADIRIERGYVIAQSSGLRGATIDLGGPRGPSVTGTANVLMAAVLARGETVILNAAREPEIVDLGEFLIALGARIDGLGTSKLRIRGVDQLGGGLHRIIPDRIEAGTLLIAGAITGGDVMVAGCRPDHLEAVLGVLEDADALIEVGRDWVRLTGYEQPQAFHCTAAPYPGVPTDLQPMLTSLATLAAGSSTIGDHVFPERFGHVDALRQMGACIEQGEATLIVHGVRQLNGTGVAATDLRAGAALLLAALAIRGDTTIAAGCYLRRGYEALTEKLQHLGGRVSVGLQAESGRRLQSPDDAWIGAPDSPSRRWPVSAPCTEVL
ncbi:MAG: UDP-N-acetylglucosamine 1-carboxyvinyltransferase [Pirellulales bacterium]|nr:UDP-N-acetylglucosamine 1-carboxyvinyltransferase [Pirellulales bacterium]